MFDKLHKELRPRIFNFFKVTDLKETSSVSKERNELFNRSLVSHLASELKLALSCKQEKVFFRKIVQSNEIIAEAILTTPSTLDSFINLLLQDKQIPDHINGIYCLIELVKKYPDIAAKNLDLLFYKLDNPFRSGKPALSFWTGELFNKSCQLALNLLEKPEIIGYFEKNKYLLANRFCESLEVEPIVAAKLISHTGLAYLLEDMGFETDLVEKSGFGL